MTDLFCTLDEELKAEIIQDLIPGEIPMLATLSKEWKTATSGIDYQSAHKCEVAVEKLCKIVTNCAEDVDEQLLAESMDLVQCLHDKAAERVLHEFGEEAVEAIVSGDQRYSCIVVTLLHKLRDLKHSDAIISALFYWLWSALRDNDLEDLSFAKSFLETLVDFSLWCVPFTNGKMHWDAELLKNIVSQYPNLPNDSILRQKWFVVGRAVCGLLGRPLIEWVDPILNNNAARVQTMLAARDGKALAMEAECDFEYLESSLKRIIDDQKEMKNKLQILDQTLDLLHKNASKENAYFDSTMCQLYRMRSYLLANGNIDWVDGWLTFDHGDAE